MAYDLYPAVDEDLKFAPEVRAANAATPEFRSQVVPMTQTQRNNLSGDELWDNRLIFNSTTDRIDRYDEGSTTWLQVTSEPAGIIKEYGGDTAPAYHVMADGGLVSRTGIYANLFAVYGTKYNIGSGGEDGTNFRLPKRAGRTAVGVDPTDGNLDALGKVYGAKTHTLSGSEMPSHDHNGASGGRSAQHTHAGSAAAVGDHTHGLPLQDTIVRKETTNLGQEYTGSPGQSSFPAGGHGHSVGVGGETEEHTHGIAASGGGTAHNNMQPSIAMNFIITL